MLEETHCAITCFVQLNTPFKLTFITSSNSSCPININCLSFVIPAFKRTVVITGATRGIGRATAILFAKNEYNVVCIYKSNRNVADELVKELMEYHINAVAKTFHYFF